MIKKKCNSPYEKRVIFCSFYYCFWDGFIACSKGGTTIEEPGGGPHVVTTSDTTQLILDIYTPVNDKSFTNGNNISNTGKISDDLGLYSGTMRITNDANGELIKEQLYEIHGIRLYNFSVSHIASGTALTNCTVTYFLRIMA